MIRGIIETILVYLSWETVEDVISRQVQINRRTGEYRRRDFIVGDRGGALGPWIMGAPIGFVVPFDPPKDKEMTAEKFAALIAPPAPVVIGLDLALAGSDQTGYAARLPGGRVVFWKEGEEPPEGISDLTFAPPQRPSC